MGLSRLSWGHLRSKAENHFIPGEAQMQNNMFTNDDIFTEHLCIPGPVLYALPHRILITTPMGKVQF